MVRQLPFISRQNLSHHPLSLSPSHQKPIEQMLSPSRRMSPCAPPLVPHETIHMRHTHFLAPIHQIPACLITPTQTILPTYPPPPLPMLALKSPSNNDPFLVPYCNLSFHVPSVSLHVISIRPPAWLIHRH